MWTVGPRQATPTSGTDGQRSFRPHRGISALAGACRICHVQLRRGPTMANDKTDASKLLDDRIRELGDWRGKTLGKVRRMIKEADPEIVEEWKWVKPTNPGTPVWSHGGGICTGETYKKVVKLTFFKGASLNDPSGLFNSSLDGKVRRAIDIQENDEIDEGALKNLIREAVALNLASKAHSD
jgi:hypothetical protein